MVPNVTATSIGAHLLFVIATNGGFPLFPRLLSRDAVFRRLTALDSMTSISETSAWGRLLPLDLKERTTAIGN